MQMHPALLQKVSLATLLDGHQAGRSRARIDVHLVVVAADEGRAGRNVESAAIADELVARSNDFAPLTDALTPVAQLEITLFDELAVAPLADARTALPFNALNTEPLTLPNALALADSTPLSVRALKVVLLIEATILLAVVASLMPVGPSAK